MPSLSESMKQHIQIGIRDIGIAIIDDIARNDLFYISISKSKDIWMESSKSHMKPLSYQLNKNVDEQYESYIKDHNAHSNDEEFSSKKYRIDNNRDVSFDEDTAELTDHQDHLVRIKRQPLDGLWVGLAWSTSNAALHVRINRVQIDNEHEFTLFPVVLNPIVSKAAGTDIPGKPFIEFSLFKTTTARSNTTHIKYLKLLVQEFVFCADQTLIMSILTFIKSEKVAAAPTINMDTDLKRIYKPLQAITEAQSNSLPAEPKIYFDDMHLSPLKGAMEGPIQFIEGIAIGTRHLLGSAVGGAAGAVSKITGVASKGLATLTFDEDYQNARIARKEISGHTVSDVVLSGKNIGKDITHGVKGVVKKPVAGAKKRGTPGFIKGLGKGFLGLIARPASGIADFTSTSFDLIKRVAVHEEVVHRVRSPRHVGRDGIIRPSSAHEIRGCYILNTLDDEKHSKSDSYIAHIDCSEDTPTWLLATSKRLLFLTEKSGSSNTYEVEWDCQYKELKGPPVVKFQPNEIQIIFKVSSMFVFIDANHNFQYG
ncbi:unnamed protein product [Rotaria sp. Silwood1]|nr:unnamed protein product [Rotaria sp. Silwood1]CAF1463206.1 unnamed protein product [Rotaria sp. Silwood1]